MAEELTINIDASAISEDIRAVFATNLILTLAVAKALAKNGTLAARDIVDTIETVEKYGQGSPGPAEVMVTAITAALQEKILPLARDRTPR